MCGIVGYWSPKSGAGQETIKRMIDRISHRGPDAEGVWIDQNIGLALGHRRLSILDLSSAGRQPMASNDKRFILIFNGEIYNHNQIRSEIELTGWQNVWRGHSDTETLLVALQIWGVQKTLNRLNGMFSFALWDNFTATLTLARDRIGEKPLYYGNAGNTFLFGSELKALMAHPDWIGQVDRNVLALYFRHAYVPEPFCIFSGMHKLPPAHWVEVKNGKVGTPLCYWSLNNIVTSPKSQKVEPELLHELEQRLATAVEMRMNADVSLGAFLSGGIDSSTIVALMQSQSQKPIMTFTIGFEAPGFNEARHAATIANYLGTEHHEHYINDSELLATIPALPMVWDEPFADSSQIPTLLLSRLAKEKVSVALSGDGADELFGGYNRYTQGFELQRKLHKLPRPIRYFVAQLLEKAPADLFDRAIQSFFPKKTIPALSGHMTKLAAVINSSDGIDFYRTLTSQIQHPAHLVISAVEPETVLTDKEGWPEIPDFREVMMFLDTVSYLPGDILTKVDRATMATSLEARVPFLDHSLIEFAWTLPLDLKVRQRTSKWALRKVLERHVPLELFDRPKMGFGVPLSTWLKGPLRNWAEDLLAPDALRQDGLLNVSAVCQIWHDHCTGRRHQPHLLWTILMYRAWRLEQERISVN